MTVVYVPIRYECRVCAYSDMTVSYVPIPDVIVVYEPIRSTAAPALP